MKLPFLKVRSGLVCGFLLGLGSTVLGGELEGDLAPFMGDAQMSVTEVFDKGRFPNIVAALDGSLVVTWGKDGVQAKRSADAGLSWGEAIVIANPGFQGGGTTVDEGTGDILAFVEEKHPPADLTLYRSRDHGQSWHAELARVGKDRRGHVPSMHMNEHGITLRRGPHKGRLIRPARYYGERNAREEWPSHYTTAVYSDDGGLHWQTSEPFPEFGVGEACVVELSDGSLYYNSRVHWQERPKNTRRRSARSFDSGLTWEDWKIVDVLPDGHQHRSYGCMGGLTRLPVAGKDILIFSNLDTPNATRERGTVWASFDGGRTWPVKRLVYGGRFGYSSLHCGRPGTRSDGWIFLCFEGGASGAAQVARFNLSWVLGGIPTGDGEIRLK